MRRQILILLGSLLAWSLTTPPQSNAQRVTGYENPYYTTGTEVSPATLVPSVRKWYLPQRLYSLYDWRQDQYSNYAQNNYERYTNVFLEGVAILRHLRQLYNTGLAGIRLDGRLSRRQRQYYHEESAF